MQPLLPTANSAACFKVALNQSTAAGRSSTRQGCLERTSVRESACQERCARISSKQRLDDTHGHDPTAHVVRCHCTPFTGRSPRRHPEHCEGRAHELLRALLSRAPGFCSCLSVVQRRAHQVSRGIGVAARAFFVYILPYFLPTGPRAAVASARRWASAAPST